MRWLFWATIHSLGSSLLESAMVHDINQIRSVQHRFTRHSRSANFISHHTRLPICFNDGIIYATVCTDELRCASCILSLMLFQWSLLLGQGLLPMAKEHASIGDAFWNYLAWFIVIISLDNHGLLLASSAQMLFKLISIPVFAPKRYLRITATLPGDNRTLPAHIWYTCSGTTA